MKVVLLAGGFGTRIAEESGVRPKPMVEIGGKPMLWHIMKIYSHYGFKEFIICLGYKGQAIKEYFSNCFLNSSDFTIDLSTNEIETHKKNGEDWKVTLVDTGEQTMTGGRIKRVQSYIGNEAFCLTYGDGVSDINLDELLDFHNKQETYATLTAVQPPGRFGAFNLHHGDNKIESFKEKPQGDSAWINGGFFVLEPEIFDYIDHDLTVWEKDPLEKLAEQKRLSAYRHHGFWHPMDTLRDKKKLEELWSTDKANWKIW
jgi:glucose-1-phosphate cytidylyltransferase